MSIYPLIENSLVYIAIFSALLSLFIILISKFRGIEIHSIPYKFVALSLVIFLCLGLLYTILLILLHLLALLFLF